MSEDEKKDEFAKYDELKAAIKMDELDRFYTDDPRFGVNLRHG